MAMSTPASTAPLADSLSLNDPSLYLDRELSLLAFQHRVLEEAQDSATPLLERVKFLSILFSNIIFVCENKPFPLIKNYLKSLPIYIIYVFIYLLCV